MADGGLRSLLRKNLPSWDWQAIESGLTGSGIPDVNWCKGKEGWIECKKTDGWKVTFQPYQVPWIMRRVRAGGRVHVLVRQLRKGGDVLWLFAGKDSVALEDEGLTCGAALGRWEQPWPWAEVAKILLSE